MIDIQELPDLARKALALEAPGGSPASLSLIVPTITAPGEPFELKAAVVDKHGYASVRFDGAVKVRGPFARPAEIEVPFAAGAPAVVQVGGVAVREEGLFRFEAELDGKVFHSNPTCCVARPERRIYWGDPHVHTVLSDCHPQGCRSLNFCYVAGRWLSGLDWTAAADHVSNGRGSPGKWKEQIALCDLHDEPGRFATLPAYEASLKGGAGGDNNMYMLRWPDMFVDEYEQGNIGTLCEKMQAKLPPDEFFVAAHHTTRTGKHGEIGDDVYPGPALMPVVEIHSKWGTSEYRGNPNPLHEIHAGPSYVVDLLNRGLKLGFIGGTDTHATMPGGFGEDAGHIDRLPGLTAVLAPQLGREAVFRAIQSRDCYATSLERIYLDVTVAGARPGQTIEWPDARAPRKIAVIAAGRSDLLSVDIVRNGETVHSQKPDSWQSSLDFTDGQDLHGICLDSRHLGRFVYYYVRITCTSGAQAWSSPVWLLGE